MNNWNFSFLVFCAPPRLLFKLPVRSDNDTKMVGITRLPHLVYFLKKKKIVLDYFFVAGHLGNTHVLCQRKKWFKNLLHGFLVNATIIKNHYRPCWRILHNSPPQKSSILNIRIRRASVKPSLLRTLPGLSCASRIFLQQALVFFSPPLSNQNSPAGCGLFLFAKTFEPSSIERILAYSTQYPSAAPKSTKQNYPWRRFSIAASSLVIISSVGKPYVS